MIGKALVAIVLLTTPVTISAQVPPPPSLPGQDQLGTQLVRAIETKDREAYAKLLSDDVHVYEDGREVATNKNDWLKSFGEKLTADGVIFKIMSGFSSNGRLLFVEYFNSTGSWGGQIPAHCCWSYDAVSYDITGDKITTIRRLRGGETELTEIGQSKGSESPSEAP